LNASRKEIDIQILSEELGGSNVINERD